MPAVQPTVNILRGLQLQELTSVIRRSPTLREPPITGLYSWVVDRG
jgi:hypothetical protein